MNPPTIQLRIVTPVGEFLHEPVELVEMTTTVGQIGVLPGHAPLMAALEIGPISVVRNGPRHWWFSGGGTALIDPEKVSMLLIGLVAHLDDEVLEACCARARAMLGEGTDELAMAAACARARHTLTTLPAQPAAPAFVPEFDIPRAQILAELLHQKHH
jgi:F-type H+-transporting ATPase subunit epsilon